MSVDTKSAYAYLTNDGWKTYAKKGEFYQQLEVIASEANLDWD